MGLETGTYISDLVATNPDGSDVKSLGDNHIRLIKSVLKNTFSNVDGAVTPTPAQFNVLAQPGTTCFPGMIVMWSGTLITIPAGWKLCNGVGTISNGNPVPNLSNRFVYGTDGTAPGGGLIGTTGGSNAPHSHTITVTPTSLTVDQMPSHNHTISAGSGQGGGVSNTVNMDLVTGFTVTTASTGSGAPHSHTASASSTSVGLPPFMALAYIIKD